VGTLSLADSSLSNWHGPSPYTRVRYINSHTCMHKLLSPLRGAQDCHVAIRSVGLSICLCIVVYRGRFCFHNHQILAQAADSGVW